MGEAVSLCKEPTPHHRIAGKGKKGDLAELEEHRDADHAIKNFAWGRRTVAIKKGQKVVLVDAGSSNLILLRIAAQIEVDEIVSHVEKGIAASARGAVECFSLILAQQEIAAMEIPVALNRRHLNPFKRGDILEDHGGHPVEKVRGRMGADRG